jgi:hypothetical protein
LQKTIVMIITVLALGAGALRSEASDLRLEPALTLGEEYNDNIFLDPGNVTDYIARVIPSLRAVYQSKLWDWDVAYAYEYRYYAHKTYDSYSTNRLNLTNTTRLIEEFLFLKVKDVYTPVSLSLARDYTQESLNVNQSDQNVLTVNPYLVFHPTQRTTLNTGYQYRDVWYKDPRASDKQEQSGYAELQHEISSRVMMTGTARYLYTSASNTRYTQDLRYTQGIVQAGPKVEYQDRSLAWGTAGISRIERGAGTATRLIWDMGVTHQAPVTSFTVQTARNWVDDPIYITRREDRYEASVTRTVDPTTLGFSTGFYIYESANQYQSRRSSVSVSAGQSFTQRLRGNASFMYDVYVNQYALSPSYTQTATRTTSDRYMTNLQVSYLAAERTTLSFGYQYTNSWSPDGTTYGYRCNRVTADVKMTF